MSQLASLASRQTPGLDVLPAVPPPPGHVPQLDNPPNSNSIIVSTFIIAIILCGIFFPIRFYAKYIGKAFNASDYISFVLFPVFWVYLYYSYSLSLVDGFLVHGYDVRAAYVVKLRYVFFVTILLYAWVIGLVRCAILLEWAEIFGAKGKRDYFTWISYVTCVGFVLFSIVLFICNLANCTPFEANWNPLVPEESCRFVIEKFLLASAAINFVLDLVPFVLAQAVIWRLKMSWQRRLGVSFVFLIGLFSVATNIVRLYYTWRFFVSFDTIYYLPIVGITTFFETVAANLVLCVPLTPRAIAGLKEAKIFRALKNYRTIQTGAGQSDDLDNYPESGEFRRTRKPRSEWFMSSKVVGTDTVASTSMES
ncbi:hypothetical protein F4861DRAFT_527008 [Xylaria intraflava]|nr:hypothetical protein F4861DRAFT_527008 [Xylaria intraflava]